MPTTTTTPHPEIQRIARRMASDATDMQRRSVSRLVLDRDPAEFFEAAAREFAHGPRPVPPHEHAVAWGYVHGGWHFDFCACGVRRVRGAPVWIPRDGGES